jgi:hypothetical protein
MHDNGPACPDGRLLALRCLGIPQVITRAPMSRRRALRYRLAAFCARLRPGNTAELASAVLRLGEEVDMHERMLDAALRDAPFTRRANSAETGHRDSQRWRSRGAAQRQP